MATYKDIQDSVKSTHGLSVKTCWIAHVKEQNGFPVRKAPNRKSPKKREHPCPDDVKPLIEKAMVDLGLM